jgi:hypothetical protein
MGTRVDVEELCLELPDADADELGPWFNLPDYHELVASLGVDVLFTAAEGDYEGDWAFVLADQSGRIGWLVFGYGSCSGCDALQACEDVKAVASLRDSLERSIDWFDSPAEFAAWAESYDWDGQHHLFGRWAQPLARSMASLPAEAVAVAARLVEDGMELETAFDAACLVDRH